MKLLAWLWKKACKVPLIGWVLAGIGLLVGGLLGRLRGRPDSTGPGRPVPSPKEIEKAKEELQEEHEEILTDIDDEWNDLEDEWDERYR